MKFLGCRSIRKVLIEGAVIECMHNLFCGREWAGPGSEVEEEEEREAQDKSG